MDNTWIIYNSDHGEMLGDHMMSHKIVFYEGAIRIPLIIRPPGGVNGWKCQGLTDHLDIATSLIDIAGAKPLTGSDGRSLIPQILDGHDSPEAQKGKDVIFSEVLGHSMVFDGRYKLAANVRNSELVELIDLKEDPQELSNKINDPSLLEIRNTLFEKHLKPFLEKTDLKKLSEHEKRRERRRKTLKQASLKKIL